MALRDATLIHVFYSGVSGASTVAVNLLRGLADRCPQRGVLYGVPAPHASHARSLDEAGIPHEYRGKRPGADLPAMARAGRRVASLAGPRDLLVFHGLRLFPLLTTARALQPFARILAYAHGPTEELLGPGRWRAIGALATSDRVVCVSEEVRRLLEGLPLCGPKARAAVVIPNGVDTARWTPSPDRRPPSREGLRLCMSGTLTPRKRPGRAVGALAQLRRRGWNATLEICGDGPEQPALERVVAELDLGACVTLHGALPETKLHAVLAESHLALLPSRSEGMSMSVLEALSCGCPVIACAQASVAEVFGQDAGVHACPGANAKALADAVEECVVREGVWADAAQTARRAAVERFSLERQCDTFWETVAIWWPHLAAAR